MKKIKTTLHLHKSSLQILDELSERTGHSRTRIIKNCMNEIVIANDMGKVKTFSQISYQDRDSEKKNWHRLHISLEPGEYEYFLDMRNLFKLSVSKIVAEVIKEYFNKILNNEIKEDSYLLNLYCLEGYYFNSVQSWVKYWGVPTKLAFEGDNHASGTS